MSSSAHCPAGHVRGARRSPLLHPPRYPCRDAVMSSNVEYLGSIQQDVGLTTGAKVVGDRMFVTSGKNISIYDISDPAAPKALGGMTANVAWENEEVPTNGKVLAVASDFYSVGVPECVAALARDRLRAVLRRARPGEHQAGRHDPGRQPHGRVRARLPVLLRPRRHDHRRARDPRRHARRRWSATGSTSCAAQGVDSAELPPHPRDPAGRPADRLPAVRGDLRQRRGRRLARRTRRCSTRARPRSSCTPRAGRARARDKFVLTGGEENFTGRCERNNSEFSVYSAEQVLAGAVDAVRGPARAGPAGRQRRLRRRQAGRRRARLLRPLVPGAPDVPRRRPRRDLRVRGRRALPADRARRRRSPSRATSSRSAARRRRPSGPARTTSCTRSTTCAGSTSCAGRASTTCRARPRRRARVPGTERRDDAAGADRRAGAKRDALAQKLSATGWSPGLCRLAAQRS